MLKEGYLRRAPDPNDGRQVRLTITPEGRAMHDQIAQYLVDREAVILDVLDKKERKVFRSSLQKLALHASNLDR